jgi:hypothetical protein
MSDLLRTIDGLTVSCAFETWDCTSHAGGAGGFDEHHRWPKTMGGPEHGSDLLILCSLHHRRQHALIRAYAEFGSGVSMVKWFSPAEKTSARYAIERWTSIGRPRVYWNVPAAKVRL